MKTPQIPAMAGMTPLGFKWQCPHCGSYDYWARNGNEAQCARHRCSRWSYYDGNLVAVNRRATDEKTVAERQWQSRKLAPKPQVACDHGLFSDDHKQTELFK